VKFVYGRSIRRQYTWYCQSPGTRWATDPTIGWELYLTAEGSGAATWWLMGTSDKNTGREIDMGTRGLKAAMVEAIRFIDGTADTTQED
jgi:hypothetical protein